MKAGWLIAATVACATASVGAQDRTQGTTASSAGEAKTVTMIGCVTREDLSFANGRKSVDGRAVTSGGTSDKFLLSNAHVAGAQGSNTPQATGTSGTTSSGNSDAISVGGPHYLLVGQSADFRQHLGQQVEVVGRLTESADVKGSGPMVTEQRRTPGNTSAAAPADSDRQASDQKTSAEVFQPQIEVSSVKLLSTSCELK